MNTEKINNKELNDTKKLLSIIIKILIFVTTITTIGLYITELGTKEKLYTVDQTTISTNTMGGFNQFCDRVNPCSFSNSYLISAHNCPIGSFTSFCDITPSDCQIPTTIIVCTPDASKTDDDITNLGNFCCFVQFVQLVTIWMSPKLQLNTILFYFFNLVISLILMTRHFIFDLFVYDSLGKHMSANIYQIFVLSLVTFILLAFSSMISYCYKTTNELCEDKCNLLIVLGFPLICVFLVISLIAVSITVKYQSYLNVFIDDNTDIIKADKVLTWFITALNIMKIVVEW